jgi:hypothetical protein
LSHKLGPADAILGPLIGEFDVAEEELMRTIPLVAITFAALFLSTIGARADGTWCAYYGNKGGGTNCGFYSFGQCMAALWGNGGFCQRNPFSAYAAEPRRRYRRDR